MRILIVCTGNILRSVMAEYLLRRNGRTFMSSLQAILVSATDRTLTVSSRSDERD